MSKRAKGHVDMGSAEVCSFWGSNTDGTFLAPESPRLSVFTPSEPAVSPPPGFSPSNQAMEATGQPSLPLENDPDRLGLFDNEEQRVLANALEDPLLRREMDMLI
jgi:hypothetical protein